MMYADAGIDLRESKTDLVYSRLAKRLRALKLESFREYCDLVEAADGRGERLEMLSALTTNVTRFFRERQHFDHLERQVLPPRWNCARAQGREGPASGRQAARPVRSPIRSRCPLLSLEPQAASLDIRMLATDIDPRVVETGREGVYPDGALDDVPAALRKRYFAAVAATPRS